MTAHLRTDSDGNMFQVWAQRQEGSCGIAAIWMAESLARQRTPEEGEWPLAKRAYQHAVRGVPWKATNPMMGPDGPQTFLASAHDDNNDTMGNTYSRFGMSIDQVSTVLSAQGLTTATLSATKWPMLLSTNVLKETTPAVVKVGWWVQDAKGKWSRPGGHFVVAARRASNGRIVYLDPWGGRLFEHANNGRYLNWVNGLNGWVEAAVYVEA